MTSKNSFFNLSLFKEILHRNLWIIALTFLSTACTLLLPVVMVMQQASQDIARGNRAEVVHTSTLASLSDLISMDNIAVKMVIGVLAIICGVAMFRYLHSRQQVDFYHSLPIRRSTLFFTNYFSGLALVLPMYLISLLLTAIVVSAGGYAKAMDGIAAGITVNLVFYLAVYTLTVLCTILCGNLIVTGLLLLWSFFSIPAIMALVSGIMGTFYNTYHTPSQLSFLLWSRLSLPIQYASMMTSLQEYGYSPFLGDKTEPVSFSLLLFGYVIAAIVLAVIAYLTFRFRKSERSGCAIAFQGLKVPLKFWCVTILALTAGLLFHEVGDYTGYAWMYFGFLFGGILTHCLMEMIYAFDFKAVFSHIKSFVIYAIVFILVMLGVRFDVTQFDKYLPNADQIASVEISAWYDNGQFWNDWNNGSLSDPENIDIVLQLAQIGIDHMQPETTESALEDTANTYYMNYDITYFKKNGLSASRFYSFPYTNVEGIDTMLDKIAFSQEYLSKCTPAASFTLTGHECMYILDGYSRNNATFDAEIIRQVMDSVRSETLQLTSELAKTTAPVLALRLESYEVRDDGNIPKNLQDYEDNYYPQTAYSEDIPIYPTYTNTLAILKNALGVEPKQLAAEDVKSITIHAEKAETDEVATEDIFMSTEATITDPADIAAMLNDAIPSTLYGAIPNVRHTPSRITVDGIEYNDVRFDLTDTENNTFDFRYFTLPTEVITRYLRQAAE